jgi:hypothetical protein
MNKAVIIEDYQVKRIVGDLEEVIRRAGVPFEELKKSKRTRDVYARFRCYRDLANMGFTLVAIAELFETSHAVVSYGIRRWNKMEEWEKKEFVKDGNRRKDDK